MNGRLTITEVAKFIGVTPRTIMRWEKTGKIKRSRRDWRGWRFYLKEDMEDIRKFYESSYEYSQAGTRAIDLAKGALVSVLILGASLCLPILCPAISAQDGMVQPDAVTETSSAVELDLAKLPAIGSPDAVSHGSKYTLGPNDVVEIDVRRHPEFSGRYLVNSEGKIEYKFIGDVSVEGLTREQLSEKLATILSDYIIEPDINVQILEYMSKVFYVIGDVNRPGKFFMRGNSVTVLEAIMQAGLPNQAASIRKCRLITPSENGKTRAVCINVYELLYGGDLKHNLAMKPGDVLYVPSTVVAKIIKVLSPVTSALGQVTGTAAKGAAMAAAAL